VRRVKRLNPVTKAPAGPGDAGQQQELFSLYRYHAVFSDSPLMLVQAEKTHRAHAIIEQVHADLKHGPLAHLPSGSFQANSAWLVLAAIAFNLTRAAGCLASALHARATTGTIRAQLINVQRAGPACTLSPHAPAAPAKGLALGIGVDPTVRRGPRTTPHTLNPDHRRKAPPRTRSGRAGQTGRSPTLRLAARSSNPLKPPRESKRWIQAQESLRRPVTADGGSCAHHPGVTAYLDSRSRLDVECPTEIGSAGSRRSTSGLPMSAPRRGQATCAQETAPRSQVSTRRSGPEGQHRPGGHVCRGPPPAAHVQARRTASPT